MSSCCLHIHFFYLFLSLFLYLYFFLFLLFCTKCISFMKYFQISCIAAVKVHFPAKNLIFFLFLHENTCCGYSFEVPHQGTSNEYPQHMFLWRNKKKYLSVTPSYMEL